MTLPKNAIATKEAFFFFLMICMIPSIEIKSKDSVALSHKIADI